MSVVQGVCPMAMQLKYLSYVVGCSIMVFCLSITGCAESTESAFIRYLNYCSDGQWQEVESLIKSRPDILNHRIGPNCSLLHMTALTNRDVRASKLLVQNGADMNTRDDFGRTPLDCARSTGNRDVVSLLLKEGAARGEPRQPTTQETIQKLRDQGYRVDDSRL